MDINDIEEYFVSNEWLFKFYFLTTSLNIEITLSGFKKDDKLNEIKKSVIDSPKLGLDLINMLRKKLETYKERPSVEDDPAATGMTYIVNSVYPSILLYTDFPDIYPMCVSLFYKSIFTLRDNEKFNHRNKC
jgi:hypothetical protein